MIKTQGLTHIHLVVRDLNRSLRFYTAVFGMEERSERLRSVSTLGGAGATWRLQ